MYIPQARRWLSVDPSGFTAGDANLYRYVGNHPTNATDPSGLYETDIHFYMTYYLANAVGLGGVKTTLPDHRGKAQSAAFAIAWFAQQVDDHPLSNPTSVPNVLNRTSQFWHFYSLELHLPLLKGFKGRSKLLESLKALDREQRIKGAYFKTVFPLPVEKNSTAVQKLLRDAMSWESLSDATFGMALHTYEDSWSHEGFQMPLGHVHTYYDGHGPDYPWREQKRALEMAKAVYDRLNVYAKQRGVKAPKATWDDIEKDIKELMAVSINDTLSAADQKKFKDGNSKLFQRDTNARIAAWKKAIKDRFGTGVDYSFQDADTWRSTVFKEAANNLKPPKDFIPSFTDVDGFIDWYKKAYEALKEREPIVGDKNWFRLLKNVYDNLNAKD